jgi:tetratricopeptide (TPR) repeat protein
MREALELAIESGQSREAAILYNNLGIELMDFDGPAAALELYQQGLRFAESRGLTEMALGIGASRLSALSEAGQLDEALDGAVLLAERAEAAGDMFDLVEARSVQVFVLSMRGLTEPTGFLEWLHSTSGSIGQSDLLLQALAVSALELAALGQSEGATALLAEVEATPGLREAPNYPAFLVGMVRVALGIGALKLAERLVADFEPHFPYAEHALVAANAALAEARGEVQAAADAYEEAAMRWEQFGQAPEHAFALLGRGRCLLALLRPTEATRDLRSAREAFAGLGARPALEEADKALAQATALSS